MESINENTYKDLINSSKINTIIDNMPKGLSKMEKAYYIYIELGKILNEDPRFVFAEEEERIARYNNPVSDKFYGICKSMAELYVSILKDERIGVDAEVVKQERIKTTHVDTILKIDGRFYIANLIFDLANIKTGRSIEEFAFDLSNVARSPERRKILKAYLKSLEEKYGKIDVLEQKEIKKMDQKLGYSFGRLTLSDNTERGFYTEDVIELLRQDMNDPVIYKQCVLKGKENVTVDEQLKYKLDYVFENINRFTHFNGDMKYLERIRYLCYLSSRLLSEEERSRIQLFAGTTKDDKCKIVSILKIKRTNNQVGKSENMYYMYSRKNERYEYKTPTEMKEIIGELDKKSFKIIGIIDKYNPQNTEVLEL